MLLTLIDTLTAQRETELATEAVTCTIGSAVMNGWLLVVWLTCWHAWAACLRMIGMQVDELAGGLLELLEDEESEDEEDDDELSQSAMLSALYYGGIEEALQALRSALQESPLSMPHSGPQPAREPQPQPQFELQPAPCIPTTSLTIIATRIDPNNHRHPN